VYQDDASRRCVMRMTITIDENLIQEAKALTGKKTKREVIEEALREIIRKKRRDRAIEHAGKIQIDITLDDLLNLRGQG
jgi:Arc/MetJ family transcription regulator